MTPDEPAALRARIAELLGGDPARRELDRGAGPRPLHRLRGRHGRRRGGEPGGRAARVRALRAARSGSAGRVPARAARRRPVLRRRHRVPRRDRAGDHEPRDRALEPGARGAARRRARRACCSASRATTTGTTASTASAACSGGARRRRRPRPSVVGVSPPMLEHYAEWAREFVRGGTVDKPERWCSSGYTPVQSASYFALPLAPAPRPPRGRPPAHRRSTRGSAQFLGAAATGPAPIRPRSSLLPDPVYHFGVAEPDRHAR